MPEDFRVALLEDATETGAVHGSKAVGEPPLMLAFSVREALRQAAAAFGPPGLSLELASPATPEAVYWAIEDGPREEPVVDWLSAAARLRETRTPGVLVTVASVRGHAPRDAGAKMVVSADADLGHGRRRQPRRGRDRAGPRAGRRARAGHGHAVGQGAVRVRRAVLRRRGHPAAGAAAGGARGRGVRHRPRRAGAGPDPGPPRPRPAPRRLARRPAHRRAAVPRARRPGRAGARPRRTRPPRAGPRPSCPPAPTCW